jgi:hypothetical protein
MSASLCLSVAMDADDRRLEGRDAAHAEAILEPITRSTKNATKGAMSLSFRITNPLADT